MSQSARLVLSVCLLLSSAFLSAQPASFQSGTEAARRGDYQQALRYFLQAREEGMDSGRLYYNIGVSHYRLGQYKAAAQAFERAAEDPELRALAYYNLALVAEAQNDRDAALSWSQRSLVSTQDEQLSRLAESLQRRLTADSHRATEPKTTMLFSAHGGYDDNVMLQADSQLLTTSDRGDTFVDAFYFARVPVRTQGPYHWNIDTGIYTQRYSRLRDYNLSMLQTGGVAERRFPGWRLEGGLSAALYSLAGHGLYRTLTLKMTSRWRQGEYHWSGFAEISGIDAANAAYEYLGGSRYRAGVSSHWQGQDERRYDIAYTIESNDREDLVTSAGFSSYSPLRQSLDLSLTTPINDRLSGKLGADGRYSRYRDSNTGSVGGTVRRQEQRYRLHAGLTYRLRDAVNLTAEYRLLRNFSNIDRYDYISRMLQFGGSIIW